jgi:hypothetical protein
MKAEIEDVSAEPLQEPEIDEIDLDQDDEWLHRR